MGEIYNTGNGNSFVFAELHCNSCKKKTEHALQVKKGTNKGIVVAYAWCLQCRERKGAIRTIRVFTLKEWQAMLNPPKR